MVCRMGCRPIAVVANLGTRFRRVAPAKTGTVPPTLLVISSPCWVDANARSIPEDTAAADLSKIRLGWHGSFPFAAAIKRPRLRPACDNVRAIARRRRVTPAEPLARSALPKPAAGAARKRQAFRHDNLTADRPMRPVPGPAQPANRRRARRRDLRSSRGGVSTNQ